MEDPLPAGRPSLRSADSLGDGPTLDPGVELDADLRVLMVDRISPTLALVKVQLEMMGGVMQDYLNLVHLDGQWWVMAKMWERVGDSEA